METKIGAKPVDYPGFAHDEKRVRAAKELTGQAHVDLAASKDQSYLYGVRAK